MSDQSDAKADASRSVHLSASAGSGKTRALKERYLALLELLDRNGLGIDQAVAITFTDKAAAEIKERVRQDLPEAMLRKIVRGHQDLRISTIHSFCMNLLKRYPLEAGLPPDFGVLDSRDQAERISRAVTDTLEDADRDPGLVKPLIAYTADQLIKVITFLISIRSRLERLEIDAGGPQQFIAAVSAGMGIAGADDGLQDLLASQDWRRTFNRMDEHLRNQPDQYEASQGALHRLLAGPLDESSAIKATEELTPVYFNKDGTLRKKPFIPKKDFSKADRKGYEESYFAVQGLLGSLRELAGRKQAAAEALSVLTLFLRAAEQYHELKLREGVLDFDDLEIHAYRLLRNTAAPDILYWLDRKILHFLVDEFQDTSDIQWAILNALTAELFAGQGADKLMAPTLFVVGDRKQSIYRFREANYRLIDEMRDRMLRNLPEESRSVRTLDRNYRSVPEVIGAVNQIFGTLWGEDYVPSESDRRDHRGSVELIEILPDPVPANEPPALTEASVLAREIRNMVEQKTAVHERKNGQWEVRPAGYGDCAILIQSRSKLKDYETALQDQGIPFRVVGGIGFYEQDEIQAIMSVLFFLWNRDDRLSLASALKSPLFGLSDSDLFGLFGGERDPLDLLAERHSDVRAVLDEWSRYAGTEPLAGLLHRIVQDRAAYVVFGRLNRQAIFNIDKLLDTAREFDRRGYTTLQDFVEWVKNIREADQREATADMTLPGFKGAVSIMTVHKAKGLEFPVVFLPGMNQQPRSVSVGPAAIVSADTGGVRLAIKRNGGKVYEELWTKEKEELRQEHQRLLYVAMTRACDRLVMIGMLEEGKGPKEHSWLHFLRQAIPAPDREEEPFTGLMRSSFSAWKRQNALFDQSSAADREKERSLLQPLDVQAIINQLKPLEHRESGSWKKATDFISQDREWNAEHPMPPHQGGLSPLTRGSFLHRCLELLTTGEDRKPEATAQEFPEIAGLEQAAKESFLHETAELLGQVTKVEGLAWIFAQGPGAYSELPFLFRRGGDLVSGTIDRVVVREGVAHVIDYKSIAIRDQADLTAWKIHYLPQVRIYCEAAQELLGVSNVRGYLLFIDSLLLEQVL